MTITFGFAGFLDNQGPFSFSSRQPPGLRRLRSCLRIRGQLLQAEVQTARVKYSLREDEGLVIEHEDRELWVKLGMSLSLPSATEQDVF